VLVFVLSVLYEWSETERGDCDSVHHSGHITFNALANPYPASNIAYVRSDSIFRFRNIDSSVVTHSDFIRRECGGSYLFHHLRALGDARLQVDSRFQFPKQGWTRLQRVGPLSQLIRKQKVSAYSLNQNLPLDWDDAKNLLMFGSTVQS
jgi:hypothetical protein